FAADVLRDVRVDLPAGAVPSGRAALQPAGGGVADAAVDRYANAGGADRRGAVGPDRWQAAAGLRAAPAGPRAGLAGACRIADGAISGPGPGVRGLRGGHVTVLRPGGERGAQLGSAH